MVKATEKTTACDKTDFDTITQAQYGYFHRVLLLFFLFFSKKAFF